MRVCRAKSISEIFTYDSYDLWVLYVYDYKNIDIVSNFNDKLLFCNRTKLLILYIIRHSDIVILKKHDSFANSENWIHIENTKQQKGCRNCRLQDKIVTLLPGSSHVSLYIGREGTLNITACDVCWVRRPSCHFWGDLGIY